MRSKQTRDGLLIWMAAVLISILLPASALALKVPDLQGRVNDYAGILSPEVRQKLEAKLAEFERTDTTQVVVLTVKSLEGDTIEDFSIRVAEAWKIGQAGKDNGVIFTVAKDDRKMRIEVGKGLEGPLTDLLSGRILDDEVRPRFKAGDFDSGISVGVEALIAATRGEYKSEAESPQPLSSDGPDSEYDIIFFVGAVVVAIIGKISRKAGTAAGAIFLPLLTNIAYGQSEAVFLAILAGVGGLLGLALSMFTAELGKRGSSSKWGSSGGSGSSFSGGGGSFGGGGSSSSW